MPWSPHGTRGAECGQHPEAVLPLPVDPEPRDPLTCTQQLIAHVSGRPNARCVLRTGDGPVCSSLLLLTVPG